MNVVALSMALAFSLLERERKYSASIIEDTVFDQARKCLEARSKQLKNEGKGNKPNAAEALTDVEENVLFEKNLLGISNAEALLITVWLFNAVHFGLRGCEEHGQMTWGDVELYMEADGTEYLEYPERQTKTRTGAEPRNVRAVKLKAFAAPNGPPKRDPVAVYKIYSEKRPDAMNKPDAPLPGASVFSGAVFNGGHFNISINTLLFYSECNRNMPTGTYMSLARHVYRA
ncbi:hypothetical protein ACROYT_G010249 [Oculina patagonica]